MVLIGRGGHVARIREAGLLVRGLDSFTVPVSATTDPGEGEGSDLLLFATKTYDLPGALESSPRDVNLVAGLQNGVTKDSLIQEKYGRERTIGALTTLGASRPEPGIVDYTFEGLTLFGGLGSVSATGSREVVSLFEESGLKARVSDRIEDDEWTKFASWTAGALISCLTGVTWYRLWTSRPLAEAFVALIREVAAVAAAGGHTIRSVPGLRVGDYLRGRQEEAVDQVLRRGSRMAAGGATRVKVSMLQDLEAGKPLELENTIGHLLREARHLKIPTPGLDLAYHTLEAIVEARADRENSSDRRIRDSPNP